MSPQTEKIIFPAKYDLQTVSIPMVRSIYLALERAGHDPKDVFEYAGIVPKIMKEDRARVDAKQYSRLFFRAVRTLNDESFGTLNRPLKPGTFALLTQWMANGITLEDALRRAGQLCNVLDSGLTLDLITDDNMATVRIHVPNITDPVALFFQETMLTTIHRLSGWLIGEYIPLSLVQVGRKAPNHKDEYPKMFRSPIRFSCSQSAFSFDPELLQNIISRHQRDVKEIVNSAPLTLLQHAPKDGSYYQRIKNILRLTSPDFPNLPAVAAKLGISEQTLRRRLHHEGQLYRDIKNEYLRDSALRMLAQTTLSLDDISLRLGFSELSAFNRAFHMWTGKPPAQYRKEFLS